MTTETTDPTEHEWVPIRTENRLLAVELTLDETAAKGYALAEEMEKIEAAREAKRTAVVAFNRTIKAHEEQAANLSAAIVKSTEEREVMCQLEGDFKGNCVRTVRLDSGAVIDERAMEEHERQGSLIDPEMPPGEATDDGDGDDTSADGLPPEAGAKAGQDATEKTL